MAVLSDRAIKIVLLVELLAAIGYIGWIVFGVGLVIR